MKCNMLGRRIAFHPLSISMLRKYPEQTKTGKMYDSDWFLMIKFDETNLRTQLSLYVL